MIPDAVRALVRRYGQEHLLAGWDRLSERERAHLVDQILSLPWERLAGLIESHVRRRPAAGLPGEVEPAAVWPAEPSGELAARYAAARSAGEEAAKGGRVAALTVAGGAGTRLGFDGPKGCLPVSPVRGKSLFQLFAESIRWWSRRLGVRIPWAIMTSEANDEATRAFFAEHEYFGLEGEDVLFFVQGMMPVFDREGRILLEGPGQIALSPDGHGGTIDALHRSGVLRRLRERGVEVLSYFQVDNPLVRVIDPLFVGLHITEGADVSSKTVPKAHDLEAVGHFVRCGGRDMVIEYTDLPESLARARNADGSRRFDAANIAIHVFSAEFLERVGGEAEGLRLPWHRAEKRVAYYDPAVGRRVEPEGANAIKLERFIFDVLPLARRHVLLATRREEEFSPIKNATGADSLETAQRDMVRRAARWLEAAGVPVPRRADGEPDAVVEISPLVAWDADSLREALREAVAIPRGAAVYVGENGVEIREAVG